jgi:hypothetical protein
LKISPIAAIPHKSKAFRSILDLSFRLWLKNGGILAAVNDTTIKSAPKGAIDQIGECLTRIIHGKTFPNGLRHFFVYLKRKNLIRLHRQSQTRLGEREVLWQGVLLVHRLLLDTDNQMGLHNNIMRLQIMSGLLDSANEVLEILMMFNGCRKMK